MLPYLTLTPIPFILTGNRTRVSCKVLLHFSWIRFIKIKSFKISETKLLLAPSRQIVVKTAWKKKSRIHLRVCNCSLLISFWRWIDSVAWCRKGRIPEQRWKRSVSDVVIDWLQERFSYTVVSKLTAAQSYLTQHLKSFKLYLGGGFCWYSKDTFTSYDGDTGNDGDVLLTSSWISSVPILRASPRVNAHIGYLSTFSLN